MPIKRFGTVTKDVILDPTLSDNAARIYSALCTYAGKQRTCFPTIATLAENTGKHRRTVQRALKELEVKNYVRRKGRIYTVD